MPTRGFDPENPAHQFGEWLTERLEEYEPALGYSALFRAGGLVELDIDLGEGDDPPMLHVRIKNFPAPGTLPRG